MISFLENQDLLSMQQFGLKSNGSASDLLLSMTTEWSKALEKGTDSHDIAGAFAKLRGYGVSGQYLPSCRLPQGKKISYCIKLSFLKWTSDECHCTTRECVGTCETFASVTSDNSYYKRDHIRRLHSDVHLYKGTGGWVNWIHQSHPWYNIILGSSLLRLLYMTRHNWCLSRGEQISHRNGLIYNLGTLPQFSGRNWDTWS